MRKAAIVLMSLGLLITVVKATIPGVKEAGSQLLNTVQAGTYALASLVTFLSVIGAVLSYLRGNARAFAGDGIAGQLAWVGTIGLSLLVAVGFAVFLQEGGPNGGPFATGAPEEKPRADLATYEQLVQSLIDATNRYSDAMAATQPEADLGVIRSRLRTARSDMERAQAQAELIPFPTRGQVRQLKGRYNETFRAALLRYRDTAQDAATRVSASPELASSLSETASFASNYLAAYDAAPDWYIAVFGRKAGSKGPKPSETTGPRTTGVPGGASPRGAGRPPGGGPRGAGNPAGDGPRSPAGPPGFGPGGPSGPGGPTGLGPRGPVSPPSFGPGVPGSPPGVGPRGPGGVPRGPGGG